ncbi:hypothetical protein BRC90_01740 [Halobacteriales archaeon QS_4_69_34]|nr:MAG: hypothetical protein BRC90_01740 [Halobacteriales archaeon QS_4_69_34]
MHVCYVQHDPHPANYSTAFGEYARHVADRGVRVSIIAGRSTSEVPASETKNGIDIHRIGTDMSTKASLAPTVFAARALQQLARIDETRSVDIVHVKAFPGLGLGLTIPTGLDLPPVVADVRSLAVRNSLYTHLSRAMIRLQRHLVDRMTVIDPGVAKQIWSAIPDVDIVPLGVDFDRFRPGQNAAQRRRWGYDDRDIVLGYTGNIQDVRRLDQLLAGFAAAHAVDDRLKLVVVGSGNALDSLERDAKRRGIADAVTFTGGVSFERVPKFLRAFDIGLGYVPDRPQYRYQPPLKTVEYLAAGLSTIATDTPGNRRFATDEENALLVPDRPQAYAAAMIRLAHERTTRERLAAAARSSVREYDYARIVIQDLMPLYERLTGRSEPLSAGARQ